MNTLIKEQNEIYGLLADSFMDYTINPNGDDMKATMKRVENLLTEGDDD